MIVADTETAGLFGPIRLTGWYDGINYNVSSHIQDFWEDVKNRDICYFHNLEFDLSKLYNELNLKIDLTKSLVINRRIVRAKIYGCNVILADSMAILASSLEKLCAAFKLEKEVAKINLDNIIRLQGYKNKDDYFRRVPINNPEYLEYLRHDVLALYELLEIVRSYAKMSEEDFMKIPTAASLSLHVFKQHEPEIYKKITNVKINLQNHDWYRTAYVGARTNRFRMRIRNGYHYDVNGLYPHVMASYDYPVGYSINAEGFKANILWQDFMSSNYSHAIVQARVFVPKQYIPPLPVRQDTRLLFPCGTFSATFVGAELMMAIKECDVKVLEVKRISVWKKGDRLFEQFATMIGQKKEQTKGAEREFWKLIGNALYGKFGMNRRRITYNSEGKPEEVFYLFNDYANPFYEVEKVIFAPYVQPQIAAHITAYARMELFRYLTYAEKHGGVWYCDTDSIVCQNPLPKSWVHPTRQGKLKLERKVLDGVYILPKLYAERSEDGSETLKSKGMLKEFIDGTTFDFYDKLLDRFQNDETELLLYDNMPNRRHMLSAMKTNQDLDNPVMARKAIRRDVPSNRVSHWQDGDTDAVWLDV